jgi:hypothetical protein
MCVDLCGVDYLEHFDRWLPEGVGAHALRSRRQPAQSLQEAARADPRAGRRRRGPRSTPSSPCTPVPRPWSARPSTSSASCFEPPRPHAHLDARGVGGSSPSKGLRRRPCARAVQRVTGAAMSDETDPRRGAHRPPDRRDLRGRPGAAAPRHDDVNELGREVGAVLRLDGLTLDPTSVDSTVTTTRR